MRAPCSQLHLRCVPPTLALDPLHPTLPISAPCYPPPSPLTTLILSVRLSSLPLALLYAAAPLSLPSPISPISPLFLLYFSYFSYFSYISPLNFGWWVVNQQSGCCISRYQKRRRTEWSGRGDSSQTLTGSLCLPHGLHPEQIQKANRVVGARCISCLTTKARFFARAAATSASASAGSVLRTTVV